MRVLPKLASQLGRRDEVPNQELASAIADKNDHKAVAELVENLGNNNKKIKSDCIKTLYEIGEIDPSMLKVHIPAFKKLLQDKDNRMVWGGMSALARICAIDRAGIYKILPDILEAADKGSVITKDNAVRILTLLAAEKRFKNEALPLLLDQLKHCPPNQLAMYTEMSVDLVSDEHKADFIRLLTKRLTDIERETMQKRIEKVIRKLKG